MIEVSHEATCPEISPVHCEQLGGLPKHTHHQTMGLTRFNGLVAVGLGKGLQLKGQLPFDHKRLTIEYQDEDGKPYDPPYRNLHHQNETLTGLGDGQLQLEYFRNVGESWVLGGGIGATIPLGKTEQDPYRRAEQSLKHQHIQMGSGTWDPIGSFSAIYGSHQWGMIGTVQGRLALTYNAMDYKPSTSLSVGAGPTYRVSSKLMLLSSAEVLTESQASWGDTPDPLSGRTAILSSAGAVYRFNSTVAVMAQARVTAAQWSITDQITQRFIGVAGVTFTPQKD